MALDKEGNPLGVPKPAAKPRGGKTPKNYGKSVERSVAKYIGGERTPGSGAFKNTNRNLEGDVEVSDDTRKPFLKLEVKARGTINSKGEKSITIPKPVVDQAVREAEMAGELAVIWGHYKGENTAEGVILMPVAHFRRLVERAKVTFVEDK